MVAYKHTSKIIIAVMAAAVVLCFLAIAVSGELTELMGGTSVRMEYESKLFDTNEIMVVDIQMDEDSWEKMLSNAMSEEYYVCDVVINGQRVNNVAIRPKGNTSLSAIAMDPETDRYSLKLEFDHFVKGQTCYGLDKLILNNNYADATNMKEAVIYDMYQYIGADASLYNYAKVSVNGEYWGVYLALEGVEQSFMLRNYGTQDGELYKPDSMKMGGGESPSDLSSSGFSMPNMGGFSFDAGDMPDMGGMDFSNFDFSNIDMSDFEGMTPPSGGSGFSFDGMTPPSDGEGSSSGDMTPPSGDSGFSFDGMTPPSGGEGFPSGGMTPPDDGEGFDPGSMPDMGDFDAGDMPDMGGFSMGGGGANLNYTDDDLDSYSTIWEGEVTGTGKSDHRRVVTALKNISEGTDLEKYLDIDNVLKYMAVHTFSVNMDSLSGSMAHNYYLYEYDGQLNIIPWDYNLSLGGMSMGSSADATEVVNDAIDTPFSGTKFFNALLENEEYLERYHAYLQQLVDEYVNGGRFDEVYNRIRNQIDELVEDDPTAFYPYDEYEIAADYLYETIKLRAESIDGQLDGTIPSTDNGQRQDSSKLIDASHIDIMAMGRFNMGGSGDSESDFGRSSRIRNRWGRPGSGENGTGQPPEGTDGKVPKGESDASAAPADGDTDKATEEAPDNSGKDPEKQPNGSGNMPDMGEFNFDGEGMPDMGEFSPGNMPNGGSMNPGSMPGNGQMPGNFDPSNLPEGFSFDGEDMPDMGDFNFDGEGMPDMGGFSFDGEGMPDMGDFNFDGEGMPDMGEFSPGNMPNGGSFTPGNKPDNQETKEEQDQADTKDQEDAKDRVELNWADASDKPKNQDQPSGQEKTENQEKVEVQDKADASSDKAESANSERERPSSFSGMPGMSGMSGQSANQTRTKNLITLGICLAIALGALVLIHYIKRK